MKFRTAKKIALGRSSLFKKYRKLRPPYINEAGNTVYPSLHNFSIICKAMRVFLKHIKRNKKRWN